MPLFLSAAFDKIKSSLKYFIINETNRIFQRKRTYILSYVKERLEFSQIPSILEKRLNSKYNESGYRKAKRVGVFQKQTKMKIFKNVLLGLMILGFAVSGCKKDKDEEAINYLQVGDSTIYLSDASLRYYGTGYSSAGAYNFDLRLVSSEVTIGDDGSTTNPGNGTEVYFETFTDNSANLIDGDYDLVTDGTEPAGSYDEGEYTFDDDIWVSFDEGTLSVKNTSSGYIINFTGADTEGNAVKFNYTGAITIYDVSSSSK